MKLLKKILPTIILIFALAACSGKTAASDEQVIADIESESVSAENQPLTEDTGSDQSYTEISDGDVDTSTEVNEDHTELHEDSDDYIWDTSSLISIQLNGDSISTESSDVSVEGSTATITAAGNYSISGSLSNGQIVVDTDDDEIVRLILNNVSIHSNTNAAINIEKAEKVLVVLADGSQNTLSDESEYVLPDAESDEPNATLFSKADLTITGNGSLTITANYNDAIASKDGLIINGGSNITITAVDDGIRGKDYLVVNGAVINVTAGGDGLKSDETDDASKGFVTIESGTITIVAEADAIDAETDVTILDGDFNLQSGGGSSNSDNDNRDMWVTTTSSAKGIIGGTSVTISGGTFTIDSADDAIHSNSTVTIQGGTFTIASGDDGMHSDSTLTIDGGQITITESYEGLESATMTINAGDISIVASDDGINLAGGVDSSGMNDGMQQGGGGGGGGKHGGNAGPGQDNFSSGSGSYYLYINGGTILIDADGDGIDSNGSIEMTGGTVIINGPTNSANGAIDYMSTFNISGGYFIAAGSSGMAMTPSSSSSQASVYLKFNSTIQSGQVIHVENSAGETIFNFSPTKEIQSIVFSTPELQTGGSYSIYVGGELSGTSSNSLLTDVTYSGGSEYTSFSITDTVTQVGGGGGGGSFGR